MRKFKNESQFEIEIYGVYRIENEIEYLLLLKEDDMNQQRRMVENEVMVNRNLKSNTKISRDLELNKLNESFCKD